MKWLLLALALVLISPLSVASWEAAASPHKATDNVATVGVDGWESPSGEADPDNDDAHATHPLSLLAPSCKGHYSPLMPGDDAAFTANYAIRAPPHR